MRKYPKIKAPISTVKTAAAVRVACSSEARIFFLVQPPGKHADQERAGGADAAGFGGRKARQERQAVQPADDKDEQQHRSPDVPQPPKTFAPRGLRTGRQKARPEIADQRNRNHVHQHREQARNDSGDKKFADVLLGNDAVDS